MMAAVFVCLLTGCVSPGDYMVIDLSGGPGAGSYPVSYLGTIPSGGWTDTYKTTKLVMRKISKGTFTMGSPSEELGRDSDETQHTVQLTKDFYIGVFEVTQR
jgi:formylglycine-generating enzyme required for sulfatase activity